MGRLDRDGEKQAGDGETGRGGMKRLEGVRSRETRQRCREERRRGGEKEYRDCWGWKVRRLDRGQTTGNPFRVNL